MSNPVAVLLSDVHFTVPTLELATAAFKQAQSRAIELNIPLILCGDTLDSKALIRAEVANRLLELIPAKGFRQPWQTKILVGNHDKIHEKASEHSLNFLRPHAEIIDTLTYDEHGTGLWFMPYQHSAEEAKALLATVPKSSTIICHQGIIGSEAGHYMQDSSALTKQDFADFRTVSGHYHRAQDIKCGRPRKGAVGLFSYVGNPYSLSFGEANDPPKGFSVLNDDGILERIPTNLRKHVIVEMCQDDCASIVNDIDARDLVWLKYTGTRSELSTLSKKHFGDWLFDGSINFKLDLIPTDATPLEAKTETMAGHEILDALIDAEPDSTEYKSELKKLWRQAYEGT